VEYQALYRKYRPQTFDDVIGQSHVTSTLAREVAEGHVAHAYLFAGPRGTGKTTTARILAKALNCADLHADGSPDNTCESCVAITEGTSLDVLELDAASHNSVEDIREMRVSVSTVASRGGARRVFILDEAHMLSKAAGNALLKTLEEPPAGVHFVLATTEPYKLLDTIRSRAQRFDFHAVGVESLAAHLVKISDAEGYRVDAAALVAVSRHALGSVRDSLSLLEQVAALGNGVVDIQGVSRALGLADADAFNGLISAMAGQDARSALELIVRLAAQGVDLRRFVSEAIGFFRGAFLAHYAPNLAEIADEPAEVLATWRKAAESLSAAEVLRAVDVLGDTLIKLREGRDERLMVELAAIKLTRPETAPDPRALTVRMDRLEKRLSAVPPPGPLPGAAPSLQGTPEPKLEEAEKPEAEASPQEQVQGAAVTMEQFKSIWPGLFGGLRDLLGVRRWALFRDSEPGGVEGNKLIITVRHDFHLEALRTDPAVAAIVATRAGDLLGSTVDVEFRSEDGQFLGDAADSEHPVDKDALVEADDASTDPFRLLETELGGTVVDEFDVDSGN